MKNPFIKRIPEQVRTIAGVEVKRATNRQKVCRKQTVFMCSSPEEFAALYYGPRNVGKIIMLED